MNRRTTVKGLGSVIGGGIFGVSSGGIEDKSVDTLWPQEYTVEEDLNRLFTLLAEFQEGVVNTVGEIFEEQLRSELYGLYTENPSLESNPKNRLVSELSKSIISSQGSSDSLLGVLGVSPRELETLDIGQIVNSGPKVRRVDLGMVRSVLEHIEDVFQFNIPVDADHVKVASQKTFLFKSVVGAAVDMCRVCSRVVSVDEVSRELRDEFYVSLIVLLSEVVLGKYPFRDQISWRSVDYFHSQYFARIQSVLGTRGSGLVMSVLSWLQTDPLEIDYLNHLEVFLGCEAKTLSKAYDQNSTILGRLDEGYQLDRLEEYGFSTDTELPSQKTYLGEVGEYVYYDQSEGITVEEVYSEARKCLQ